MEVQRSKWMARGMTVAAMALPLIAGAFPALGKARAESEAGAAAVVEQEAKPAASTSSKTESSSKKFEDWALVCPDKDDADGKVGCRIVQSAILNIEAKDGEEPRSERVMLTAIGFVDKSPEPILTIIVPLGILLTPGLLLEVEGYDQLKIPLQRCDANGCLGLHEMKTQLVEAFRVGKEAHVSFFNIAGKANRVRLSLAGFSKAMEALSKARKTKS